MVNFAWDELREEPRALRALAQKHDACMGVYAEYSRPVLYARAIKFDSP